MVHITNTIIVAALLVAPTIAIPIANYQDVYTRSQDIENRNFKSFLKKMKKVAGPAVKMGMHLLMREDGPDSVERDLSEVDYEELAARDPNFGHVLGNIRKVVNPHNIAKVGHLAHAISHVLGRDIEESSNLLEREITDADLEDLAAREPNFKHFLKKLKKVALPAAKMGMHLLMRDDDSGGISLVFREESPEVYEREITDAHLEQLAARDPNFGSFLRKIKKVALPAAKIGMHLLIREDGVELVGRDLSDFEYQELAARDPNFLGNMRKVFNPHTISQVGHVVKAVSHVLGRGLEELDELD
ncbi:hypothetical protein B0H34DRAFT_502692 [Crassisporium funariophilum]|nr:hypothetical protein B0H34DRAFT_502692 [Crassisporium funariophilum]